MVGGGGGGPRFLNINNWKLKNYAALLKKGDKNGILLQRRKGQRTLLDSVKTTGAEDE